jgi:hypothetical protein
MAETEQLVEDGDLMWGGRAIAAFISRLSDAEISDSKVYQWIEAGQLPVGRLGSKIFASKAALRRHFVEAISTAQPLPAVAPQPRPKRRGRRPRRGQ